MSTSRRDMVIVATIALVLGSCAGASSTASGIATPALTHGVAVTPSPSPSSSSSPSAAAVRPGYILLEHFGNALDGTSLKDTDSRHLWLVHSDGSNLHELAPGQPTASDGAVIDKGPADWSPDGTHIVYSSATIPRLYETDVTGTAPRLLATVCDGTEKTCLEAFPSYSPDGERIAFVRLSFNPLSGVIGILDLTTKKVTLLESTRKSPPREELGAPAWSPDGTKLAYYEVVKDKDGKPLGPSEMFIINADGTHRHALTTPGLAAGDPRWSPDGSTLVFSTEPIHQWNDVGVADQPDVYIVHPDGSDRKRLTSDGGSGAPSWTPDGKILFFSQRELWLMDADGSNRTYVGPGKLDLVSDETGFSYYARWQPTP